MKENKNSNNIFSNMVGNIVDFGDTFIEQLKYSSKMVNQIDSMNDTLNSFNLTTILDTIQNGNVILDSVDDEIKQRDDALAQYEQEISEYQQDIANMDEELADIENDVNEIFLSLNGTGKMENENPQEDETE